MARSKARLAAPQTLERLRRAHPDAHCELKHDSAFQLVIATVLSAQSTDVAVNQVTPVLFRRWPTPEALATAEPEQVQQVLARLGMFRQKSKNIIGLAKMLLDRHDGAVPNQLAQLVALPGVGRKTANVVLGVAFGTPEGVVVDTHVQRITQRLGWTKNVTPEKIESDLMKLFGREHWDMLSHTVIFHGRRICTARNPACASCPITDVCASAFNAENVGRKPLRTRPSTHAAPKQQAAKQTSAKKQAASVGVAARKRAASGSSAASKSKSASKGKAAS